MIKVGVRDEHEVDGRKVAGPEAGVAEALHRAVPERPVWVDDHIHAADLGEETRMAEPSDTELVHGRQRQFVDDATWFARSEDAGDEHLAEELQVSLPPSFRGSEADVVFIPLAASEDALPIGLTQESWPSVVRSGVMNHLGGGMPDYYGK